MQLIEKYFPGLSDKQKQRFDALKALYADWNNKINVISRKDIDNLEEHHVLHSLAIAKRVQPVAGSVILDLGTGGGFPGIPLAILFPNVKFVLIDSIGKKIKVAASVAESLQLGNVTTKHLRAEEEHGSYDFVVSRAVMPFDKLVKVARKNIKREQMNAIPNGIICLKGGDLAIELESFPQAEVTDISQWFEEEWFKQDKKVIYLPL